MQTITAKIKEILEIKGLIMEQKYAHKIDMRNILNDTQKVSFDLDILDDTGKKNMKLIESDSFVCLKFNRYNFF